MKILSKFWEQMERDGRLGEEKRSAHSFLLLIVCQVVLAFVLLRVGYHLYL